MLRPEGVAVRVRQIFLGPIGLRSGWRLLIFLAITVGLLTGLQEILYMIINSLGIVVPEGLNPTGFLVEDALTIVCVLVASGVMARWERRKLAAYGLLGKTPSGGDSGKERRLGLQESLYCSC
jgi:CAAX protease family protein